MVLFDTTFRAIEKVEINWKRLTFYLVEPRPKSKSYAKSVVKCFSDTRPLSKAGEPSLSYLKRLAKIDGFAAIFAHSGSLLEEYLALYVIWESFK